MRIAMVSTPFLPVPPPGYGGTERVIHELTEGLVGAGHDVELFSTGDSRTSARLRYLYDRSQWPMTPLTDLNHASWALSQARGFDLVHVHSAEALAFSRMIGDTPMVYTLHHVRESLLSEFYRYFPDVHFISISHDQRSREVPLPRGTTIHHGLSPEGFEWSRSPSSYVAFVGRFAEIKGVHTAIDVAEEAGVPIRVAGEVHPVDQEYGEREVWPRMVRDHVTYLGTIGPGEKVPLLRDARAVLFPITWNEPFGLVLIEAMLSGCPPIAFRWGSVPELVEEGVTGFVVDGHDEMVCLLRPGSRLDSFDRARCRERAVERFAAQRMVREHERLYLDILVGPARRGSRTTTDASMRDPEGSRSEPDASPAPRPRPPREPIRWLPSHRKGSPRTPGET